MLTPDAVRAALANRERATDQRGKPAAVLVGIADNELLFEKRPADLRQHGGQVSFPGGSRDPGDADSVATALREAQEELAIASDHIEVVGLLDDLFTVTNFTITPVVGFFRERPKLVREPGEVEDAFWVDLDRLRDERLWRHMDFTFGGRPRASWFFDGAAYVIWGATAEIVRQFLNLTGHLR